MNHRNGPLDLTSRYTRRALLRVGGLGLTGLLWSDLLRAHAAASKPAPRTFDRAKACILVFNYGGPSHIDTWDHRARVPRDQAPPASRGRAWA